MVKNINGIKLKTAWCQTTRMQKKLSKAQKKEYRKTHAMEMQKRKKYKKINCEINSKESTNKRDTTGIQKQQRGYRNIIKIGTWSLRKTN